MRLLYLYRNPLARLFQPVQLLISTTISPVRLFCTVRSLILLVFTPLYGYFTLYYYSVPETNITLMPSF